MRCPTTPGEGYWEKTQRFLQELSVEGTYLYGKQSDPNDLAWTRAEASSTFAIPLWYNIETPLLVTPGFAFNWLQGPATDGMPGEPDLPAQVYDAYLDFAWYPRVTEYLGGELGFRTGVWSDFSFWDTDSIRFLGRGLANVSLTPQMDILFGAVYLDRLNVKLLPAGGVYWRPTPEWDLYLVFPQSEDPQLHFGRSATRSGGGTRPANMAAARGRFGGSSFPKISSITTTSASAAAWNLKRSRKSAATSKSVTCLIASSCSDRAIRAVQSGRHVHVPRRRRLLGTAAEMNDPSPSDRLRFSAAILTGAAIHCFVSMRVARAELRTPTTPAPPQAWGGYAVAQAVPYQPTLDSASRQTALRP